MKTNTEPRITITPQVLQEIRETIGRKPAETGGMLGGDFTTGVVTHFHFDKAAACTPVDYSPNTAELNELLPQWNAEGVRLLGFVHSHPPGLECPTDADEIYARAILEANPELPTLLIPIVQSSGNGREFTLRMFVAERASNGVRLTPSWFRIAEPEEAKAPGRRAAQVKSRDATRKEPAEPNPTPPIPPCPPPPRPSPSPVPKIDLELFKRVTEAYDLEVLAQARLVWIGVGGAAASAEDLARAGVGQFVLVDPGLVEECNLATQAYYQADIGKPKVQVLARRLRAVNPRVLVCTRPRPLEDLADSEFEALATSPLPGSRWSRLLRRTTATPKVTVIVGATDDFAAQARVNRLALQFGLPSVCCQLYDRALAGELTFTHPQTTPACHRCILSSRFRAYLKDGYKNAVGSAGSPISSTGRLNALTTAIVLAILHRGTGHPRWGGFLERIGRRNLIQVRCHPDVQEILHMDNFTEALAGSAARGQIFFDETIWRPQAPEHPRNGDARPCPDCGGLGYLAACKGRFTDTRIMIPEP